jgi:hypothetical protein
MYILDTRVWVLAGLVLFSSVLVYDRYFKVYAEVEYCHKRGGEVVHVQNWRGWVCAKLDTLPYYPSTRFTSDRMTREK